MPSQPKTPGSSELPKKLKSKSKSKSKSKAAVSSTIDISADPAEDEEYVPLSFSSSEVDPERLLFLKSYSSAQIPNHYGYLGGGGLGGFAEQSQRRTLGYPCTP